MNIIAWIEGLSISLAYLAYFTIIFAESGLLIGFFLPGDSLLFSMGLLAAKGHLSFPWLLILGIIAAITGDTFGYIFGKRIGPKIFSPDTKRRFLNREHLEKTQAFYDKHGVKTIILARFTPFARTFAPILAGVSEMDYKLFLTYNILGGLGWVISVTSVGYFLGKTVPNIEIFVIPIIAGIIIITAAPALISAVASYIKSRRRKREK